MVILLVVMVPAAALVTPAAQQSGNFFVSITGTAVGSVPHQIDLKVAQLPGGQLSEVGGFIIAPEDVVQVKQGENLTVSTSADLKTHNVKVTNAQGQLIDLLPLSSNTWSLQGLTPGVYKLDVIVDMSSSGIMGAYETVLVILQPDQRPAEKTEVTKIIQTTEIETELDDYLFTGWPNAYCEGEGDARICWESKEIKEQAEREIEEERKWREENEGQLPQCEANGNIEPCTRIVQPIAGCVDEARTKCYTNSYELQKLLEEEAKNGVKAPPMNLGFVGSAPVEGESPQPTPMDPRFDRYQPIIVDTACFLYGQGCDEFEQDPSGQHFYDTQTGKLFKYKPINDVPLCHDPYYMAGRLGSTCHDEGDPTDPVTVTPVPSTERTPLPPGGGVPEPEPCTPGSECPPCPEGVEASWCADDDEQNDIDECIIDPAACGIVVEEEEESEEIEESVDEEEESNGNENEDDPEPVID
jgi:hypothetical protein